MRVFLDTNILLDAIVKRSESKFTEDARTILALGETGVVELYMSIISIPTIAYVLRKISRERQKRIIRDLVLFVKPLPSLPEHIDNIWIGRVDDIEDSLQVQSAKEGACNLIVTRNCRDFVNAGIPAITPSEFLKKVICA